MRAWAAWVSVLAVATLGCAKREPPSGGPPDIEPPRLISAKPDSGSAAGVPATLSLTFSEPMEPRYTSAAVQLAPPVKFRRARWEGLRTLTLEPDEPLLPNHTYTMVVGPTARDRHGNDMETGATVVFSTGTTFPRGRIEGELNARGFDAAGTSMWCYDASRTGVPDSTARDFDAVGQVGDESTFRIDGLTVPGRYRLWAFADLNGNRSFEPDQDVLAAVDTVIELTEANPVVTTDSIVVVNPRAPGFVRGVVVDSLADSSGVVRVVAIAENDTTTRGYADLDRDGKFELSLKAGRWVFRAFLDKDGNKDWEPAREPASAPVVIELLPAVEIADTRLVLRGPP